MADILGLPLSERDESETVTQRAVEVAALGANPAEAGSDVLGYIDHCREQARKSLGDMTDEKAATPLPAAHRYSNQPYAWILTGLVIHTTEHASQIRQFINGAGSGAK